MAHPPSGPGRAVISPSSRPSPESAPSPPESESPPDSARHPALALDDVVHQRVRLGILVVLGEVDECSFPVLRDQLELTDGNLNRHLRVLEEAGLVEVRKAFEGRRPRTWLRLTRAGRAALRDQLAVLERLVAQLRQVTGGDQRS